MPHHRTLASLTLRTAIGSLPHWMQKKNFNRNNYRNRDRHPLTMSNVPSFGAPPEAIRTCWSSRLSPVLSGQSGRGGPGA